MPKNKRKVIKRVAKVVALVLCVVLCFCLFSGMSILAQSAAQGDVSSKLQAPDLSETLLIVLLVILIVCEVVGSGIIIFLILRSLPKNKKEEMENPEVNDDEQI